jgi:hypothetical protein
MIGPIPGGRRRIDRVLAPDYLEGMDGLELDDVRALRRDAEQEEADLSYIRRMLQGRIDIVRAELARRSGAEDGAVMRDLADILASAASPPDPARSRFLTVGPTRVAEQKRAVEQVVTNVQLSDVEARTDEQLHDDVVTLRNFEQSISENRHRVQHIVDSCAAEIGRRYREGGVTVADILPGVLS